MHDRKSITGKFIARKGILRKSSNPKFIAAGIVVLACVCLCACGHPPVDGGPEPASQKLPFDRQARTGGVSPSQSMIPSSTKLTEGTPVLIRLQSGLSSASAHAGETFDATVDEPVVIDGLTLLARGTRATGSVLEAKAAYGTPGGSIEPGYLRIAL